MAAVKNNKSNTNATKRLVLYLGSVPSLRDIDYDRVFRMIRQEGADISSISGMLFDYYPGMGMKHYTLLMGALMGHQIHVGLIKDLIDGDALDQSKHLPHNGDTLLHVLLDGLADGDAMARKEVLKIIHDEDPELIVTENSVGVRPLDVAIRRCHDNKENGRVLCEAVLDILSEEKSDLNALPKISDPYFGDGKTYLMLAAEEGCNFVAERLLELGADMDGQNEKGMSALMFAVEQGNGDIVTLLLQHGADVDLQNKSGKTALMIAMELGMYHVMDALLNRGARQNLKSNRNQAARNMTRSKMIRNRLNHARRGGAKKTHRRRRRN